MLEGGQMDQLWHDWEVYWCDLARLKLNIKVKRQFIKKGFCFLEFYRQLQD